MFSEQERKILRQLAERVHEIAALPEQQKKRDMWRKHAALRHGIPPIFVSPEGAWEEIFPPSALKCEHPFAREVEKELRQRIFRHEHIRDDVPVEDHYDIPVSSLPVHDCWGLPARITRSGPRGAWAFDPVIEEMEDWEKLDPHPRLRVDRKGAEEKAKVLKDTVGDALQVHVTGIKLFEFYIANIYTRFRGLDNFYLDLMDDEERVKAVFARITEGTLELMDQAREMELIRSNNDYTYHYTGGLGYCDDLPPYSDQPASLSAVWGAAEAEEYACVSPEMFYRTMLPFEKQLLERFGLSGYGCCEDLTEKLDGVLEIKNLRRVAACPWADLGKMAARLKKNYILTWKPNPAYLAGEYFDEAVMEKYMRESLEAAKGGYPEIILRDTHSCRSDPFRFTQFVQVTRRAIEKVYNL